MLTINLNLNKKPTTCESCKFCYTHIPEYCLLCDEPNFFYFCKAQELITKTLSDSANISKYIDGVGVRLNPNCPLIEINDRGEENDK